jgi:glycolate dehydrogenase FAD-binding subunit
VITALDRVRTELAAIVGAARVVADDEACAVFSVDGQKPKLVVYPSSAEQVAQALCYAARERLAVIPSRNTTKLAMGNPPREYDVALSLKEMNRVWHYEPDDLTISVEPGMKLGDFQHFVGRHNLWLPLNPPGGTSASMGGIVATNATGSYRCHYGAPRDMVLGMKIATTEGKVIKAGGRVVKNVAGYDLTKLLIGSCGTLGVIVEMSFKLFPRPAEFGNFVLTAATWEKAREIRRALQQSPIRPLRAVLLDTSYMEFLKKAESHRVWSGGCEVWVEVGGTKRVIERCSAELNKVAAHAGETMRPQEWENTSDRVWWRVDEPHPDVRANPLDWLLKVSLPAAALEEYLIRANRELRRPEHFWTCWAEPLGGIVRLWLHPEPVENGIEEAALGLRRLAGELGGALLVEIAPAAGKDRVDAWGAVGDDFQIMRKLKDAWDPNHILSPGRFVGRL